MTAATLDRRHLSSRWIVGSALLPPAAWLLHIAAMPALVPLACDTGRSWPMHVTTAVCALIAVAGIVGLHRTRAALAGAAGETSTAGSMWPLVTGGELVTRARMWAGWGLVSGWMFLGLTLAEHVPVFLVDPCPP